jgi:hypothetical protein
MSVGVRSISKQERRTSLLIFYFKRAADEKAIYRNN